MKAYRNRSVMKHNFAEIPRANIPRSSFRRSHGHTTAFDAGYLIPIFVDEAVPGDTFTVTLSSIARLSTPIVPFMDNLYLDYHFFAVPNRLLWDNWEKFMGAQDDPGDSTDYLVPTITSPSGGWTRNCLYDYMGLPVGVTGLEANNLHGRAYNLIWNEWFRDQNLQDSVTVDTDDGPDTPADYVCLKRGKRHDYFTSCLPWPQKGDSIDLPLGDSAPVVGDGKNIGLYVGSGTEFGMYYDPVADALRMATGYANQNAGSTNTPGTIPGIEVGVGLDTDGTASHLEADLSSATAASINSLREAFQLQKLLERDARGGTRYVEKIKAHFGVVSPDFRLQRPEFLGGGTRAMEINAVPQTSQSDTTAQGTLAAYGYQQNGGIGFTKSFVEHSVIIGLVSLRADLRYQAGQNRMWNRQTQYDFYFPATAHLGEQSVLNKEIFAQATSADDEVFGYQERWAEMRYKPSLITGIMRSQDANSLDVWHLAQDIDTLPSLNSDFIEEDPPIDRVIATPSEPHCIFDGYFDMLCARPMPLYSVPGYIDHF